jgi:phytoene synthase
MLDVVRRSKNITKQYGSNYYRASSLFPQEVREAVYVYYAWVRCADEMVDQREQRIADLQEWIDDFHKNESEKQINKAVKKYFTQHAVPGEYPQAFLGAMSMDVSKKTYATYEELEQYMYGSAAVVGLTMLCFFDLHRKDLIPGATKLGQAMQLTNFLRDIREDHEELGRIYLPQEDMNKFGVTGEDIANRSMSDQFKELMKFEVERCRGLYSEAWTAIEKLSWRLKFPVRIAARNYEGVLDEIEKAGYDIWHKKHGLSKFKKFVVIIKSLFV